MVGGWADHCLSDYRVPYRRFLGGDGGRDRGMGGSGTGEDRRCRMGLAPGQMPGYGYPVSAMGVQPGMTLGPGAGRRPGRAHQATQQQGAEDFVHGRLSTQPFTDPDFPGLILQRPAGKKGDPAKVSKWPRM